MVTGSIGVNAPVDAPPLGLHAEPSFAVGAIWRSSFEPMGKLLQTLEMAPVSTWLHVPYPCVAWMAKPPPLQLAPVGGPHEHAPQLALAAGAPE